MSGHSKWKTIKEAKGAKDAKRSSEFSKIAHDISVAVKTGKSGDINFNPMLRVAVDKAKGANMPNDKIKNAIDKALGIGGDNTQIFSNTYEAYSPSGVGLLIDVETDNPNRTLPEIKSVMVKSGGKVLSEGAISWQFREIGEIIFKIKAGINIEDVEFQLLDISGINDFEVNEADSAVYLETEKTALKEVNDKLVELFKDQIEISELHQVKVSANKKEITQEEFNTLMEFISKLEEIDEVINIWHNADII